MTFAQKYSRDFERLSQRLLSQELRLPIGAIHLTPARNDGGLDGNGRIDIGVILDERLGYNFAFEAKLRTDDSGAGLDIFAKSMIIAFNAGHHGLALTTNKQFSPQCVTEAARFRIRTRMDFFYVDGPRISFWVRHQFNKLLTENYSKDFLEGLLWAGDEQVAKSNDYRKIVVSMNSGGEHIACVKFQANSGSHERLIGRVEITKKPSPPGHINLLGVERNRTFNAFKSSIESGRGLHILWGDPGVGKSVLVRHVGQEREAAGWLVTRFDMRQISTARELFLKVLVPLLGADLSLALSEVGDGNAGALLRSITGEGLPDADINAVAAVLSRSHASYRERSDLDHAVLLLILKKIIERRSSRDNDVPHHLFIFDEVTYTHPEILDFLAKLLPILSDDNVILLESRFSDLSVDKEKHWQAFKSAILGWAASQHTLPSFNRDDALAYAQELLPGIGVERANVIVTRVGTTPLFLETAAEYLHRTGAVRAYADGRYFIVEDLELFFEGIVPEKAYLLIGLQVAYWANSQQKLQKIFLAAALLDGILPSVVAESAVAADEVDKFFDEAIKTRLFEASGNLDKLVARHGLIVDALQAYAHENQFATQRVALGLLEVAPLNEPDPLRRKALKAILTEAAGRVEEAIDLAHETGIALLQQHQLEQADRFLTMADRLCAKADTALNTQRRYEVLLDLLELRDQRYLLGSERTATPLRSARILWEDRGQRALGVTKEVELRLRAGYILWRAEHTRENFIRAEELGRALVKMVSDTESWPIEVAGAALSALGTTLKALGRQDESREAFTQAMEKASKSLSLRVQLHSNEASLSLAEAPADALTHYEAILEMTAACAPQFLPHLHAQVDCAMALFLMHNYEYALDQARLAEQISRSNGVAAQVARSLNIMGCLLWRDTDTVAAHDCFQQAVLNAERSYSDRFLWRMRTNLAATALELKMKDEAKGNALSAARKILAARSGLWPKSVKLQTARWYHALVQCCAILWRLGLENEVRTLAQDVKAECFLEKACALADGESVDFVGSLHAGRIMITG